MKSWLNFSKDKVNSSTLRLPSCRKCNETAGYDAGDRCAWNDWLIFPKRRVRCPKERGPGARRVIALFSDPHTSMVSWPPIYINVSTQSQIVCLNFNFKKLWRNCQRKMTLESFRMHILQCFDAFQVLNALNCFCNLPVFASWLGFLAFKWWWCVTEFCFIFVSKV